MASLTSSVPTVRPSTVPSPSRQGSRASSPCRSNISQSGDTITVSLPTQTGDLVSADMPATVILLGVSSQETVDIVRGENRGQHVTYRNVVRSHAVLGEWTGGAQSYTVSRSARVASGCGRAVVLLQVGNPRRPGAMLGAAIARLQ